MGAIGKYYRWGLLLPAGLVIASYAVYCLLTASFSQEYRSYKSEWLTAEDTLWISLGVVVANACFVCLLALTAFFSAYRPVRTSRLLSLGSWLLGPGCWLGYLLARNGDSLFVLANTLPYLVGIAVAWARCRRTMTSGKETATAGAY